MWLEHGTLGALSRAEFAAETALARECEAVEADYLARCRVTMERRGRGAGVLSRGALCGRSPARGSNVGLGAPAGTLADLEPVESGRLKVGENCAAGRFGLPRKPR